MLNLDVEKINSLPIIILSSPRTGSTMLGMYIQKKLNLHFFNEPGNAGEQALHKFLTFEQVNKKYVLKEHTLRYIQYYPNTFKIKPAYKIRLRRKNVFEQILSKFVAVSRNKHFYANQETYVPDIINLDKDRLIDCFNYISKFNIQTNSLSSDFDLDLFYEDLNIDTQESIPTPKPANAEEVSKWAYAILKNKI